MIDTVELKKLTADSQDIGLLEEINREAIPECERNSFGDLMDTGAAVLGIYEDGPVGFLVIREYKNILYLAYLAVNSALRSKGIGSKALKELVSNYADHMIVVEYEAPDPSAPENELNIRRKGFYKRNGFRETGYFTFYDDIEFEIGCAGMEFDAELFGEFTEYLSTIVSDHIPKPYKKL
jgi:GNAT superfamily N-acetyltransferase